jgi:hypothetical protein
MADDSAKAEARDALLPFTRGIAFGQVIERVAHGVTVDDEVEIARSTLQLEAGDEGEKVNMPVVHVPSGRFRRDLAEPEREPDESRASASRIDWVLPWILRPRGSAREPAGTTISQF